MSEGESDIERWRRDPEQAHQDFWGLRILDCPDRTCARAAECRNKDACAAAAKHPLPEGLNHILLGMFRRAIVERHAAVQEGPEADAAWKERTKREWKRRKRLGFERARKKLGIR